MAVGLIPRYRIPTLSENNVYPTRLRHTPIKQTFQRAAFALLDYDNLIKERKKTSLDFLGDLGLASQLILDASGYLFQHQRTSRGILGEFIFVYQPVFPNINPEKKERNIHKLAPLYAEATRDLSQKLTNPERLSEEERTDLAKQLEVLRESINAQQHRMDRYNF